jgi:phosphatidylglycerophosphate synthase
MNQSDGHNATTRRPIRTRGARWAGAMASMLARHGARPNTISLMSIAFALIAGAAFTGIGFVETLWMRIALFVVAVGGIQMRLLCNLFDGMVAIEGGFKTRSGEIFNDFPDQIADPLVLIGAGYCMGTSGYLPVLGWSAAVLAILTAYARVLAASAGAEHRFLGPMAKQHRMAVMTVGAVGSIIECVFGFHGWVLTAALGLIILGCLVTIWRRLRCAIGDLERDA